MIYIFNVFLLNFKIGRRQRSVTANLSKFVVKFKHVVGMTTYVVRTYVRIPYVRTYSTWFEFLGRKSVRSLHTYIQCNSKFVNIWCKIQTRYVISPSLKRITLRQFKCPHTNLSISSIPLKLYSTYNNLRHNHIRIYIYMV